MQQKRKASEACGPAPKHSRIGSLLSNSPASSTPSAPSPSTSAAPNRSPFALLSQSPTAPLSPAELVGHADIVFANIEDMLRAGTISTSDIAAYVAAARSGFAQQVLPPRPDEHLAEDELDGESDESPGLQVPVAVAGPVATTKKAKAESRDVIGDIGLSGARDKILYYISQKALTISPPVGCWLSTLKPNKNNKGYIGVKMQTIANIAAGNNKRTRDATTRTEVNLLLHRISLVASLGVDLGSLMASHLCGQPACFRPDHLVAESQSANISRNTCRRAVICDKGHLLVPGSCTHSPRCLAQPPFETCACADPALPPSTEHCVQLPTITFKLLCKGHHGQPLPAFGIRGA